MPDDIPARPRFTPIDTTEIGPDDPRYADILRAVFLSGYVPEENSGSAAGEVACSVIVATPHSHMDDVHMKRDFMAALVTVTYLKNFATGADLDTAVFSGFFVSYDQPGADPATEMILTKNGLCLRLDEAHLCSELPEYLITFFAAFKARIETDFRRKQQERQMPFSPTIPPHDFGLTEPSYEQGVVADIIRRTSTLPVFFQFVRVGDQPDFLEELPLPEIHTMDGVDALFGGIDDYRTFMDRLGEIADNRPYLTFFTDGDDRPRRD